MIDLSKYLIFENNKKTFKETSKDDHDGSITYMTESQYQVISFDDVKEEYIKDLGLKSVPRSNDALLSLPDGSLVFVEFKNGYIDLKDQYDIRKKIFDSMLMLGFTVVVFSAMVVQHAGVRLLHQNVFHTGVCP